MLGRRPRPGLLGAVVFPTFEAPAPASGLLSPRVKTALRWGGLAFIAGGVAIGLAALYARAAFPRPAPTEPWRRYVRVPRAPRIRDIDNAPPAPRRPRPHRRHFSRDTERLPPRPRTPRA